MGGILAFGMFGFLVVQVLKFVFTAYIALALFNWLGAVGGAVFFVLLLHR